MYSVLIEHPTEGLILFETGPGPGVTGTEEDYESEPIPTLLSLATDRNLARREMGRGSRHLLSQCVVSRVT
jgi:hypothetical protein